MPTQLPPVKPALLNFLESLSGRLLSETAHMQRFLATLDYRCTLRYLGLHGLYVPAGDLARVQALSFHAPPELAGMRSFLPEHFLASVERMLVPEMSDLNEVLQLVPPTVEDAAERCGVRVPLASRPYYRNGEEEGGDYLFVCAVLSLEDLGFARPFKNGVIARRAIRLRPIEDRTEITLMRRSFAEELLYEYMSAIIVAEIESQPATVLPTNFARDTASHFISSWLEDALQWRTDASGPDDIGVRFAVSRSGLFEWCSAVAYQEHEREPLEGALLLSVAGRPGGMRSSLTPRVSCESTRTIGKLLLCSRPDFPLVVHGHTAYGFGRPTSAEPPSAEGVVLYAGGLVETLHRRNHDELQEPHVVQFAGRGRWSWRFKDAEVFEVRDGEPRGPRSVLSQQEFVQWFRTHLGSTHDARDAWSLVQAVRDGGHGALLVISAAAEVEARRLGVRFALEAARLAPDELERFTRIDGAVLLAQDGTVHAFGCILDGEAGAAPGDVSRGSRYNAAVTYVAARRAAGTASMAVVISEDGFVNVV